MNTPQLDTLALVARGRQLGRDGQGRRIREAAGLKLRDVAKLGGLDFGSLSLYERGLAVPSCESAMRWVLALDEVQRALTPTDRAHVELVENETELAG